MAELHDIILDGVTVTEMEAGVEDYVPLDPKLVAELTQGDDNPQFPVICIESGVSTNKFEWPHDILVDAAEQVNKLQPVGYLGHIRPEDDRYAFPPPQTKWLRAVTKKEGDKTKLYVKGYNLPEPEPIRRYVRMGLVDSTSWKGKASVQHLKGGIQRVTQFALESIDWSRKGKAAMSARLVTVAAEQEGAEEVADLSKVSIAEITAENPNLVELIKRDGAADAEAKIAEMEPAVEEVEGHRTLMTKLRELLGIDEKVDLLEAVGELQEKFTDITTKNVKERVGELLKSKVKDDDARAAVLRLIPVNEMEDLDDDALKTRVEETMEKDETVKAIVSRFSGAAPPANKKKEIAEMGGGDDNGRYDSGKSTSNVKVTRTKV
jgi:hypothetical protein